MVFLFESIFFSDTINDDTRIAAVNLISVRLNSIILIKKTKNFTKKKNKKTFFAQTGFQTQFEKLIITQMGCHVYVQKRRQRGPTILRGVTLS